MPFEQLSSTEPTRWRTCITGPPNSRKTTSLLTWPFTPTEGLHILSFPGEKGYDSIDTTVPGVHAYIWRTDDPSKLSPHAVIKEVEQETWDILGGKHGKVMTFGGDGLQKLYGWYYKRARVDIETRPLPDDKKDLLSYPVAHDDFNLYLHRVCHSTVPYAVFTVWDGRELDDPESPLKSKGPSHILPDLPGKMAKRIMGEFPVILYAEVGMSPGPGKPAKATWQLQAGGSIHAAGCKVPPRIAATLPTHVEQDWKKLEVLLRGGVK